MKKLAILLLPILFLLTLSGCTNPFGEDVVITSTALRSVITQYDEKQDPNLSVEERKKTHINVEKIDRISKTEAQVYVRVQTPTENKLVPVHVVKKEAWSVTP
jgi:hypothetical protein